MSSTREHLPLLEPATGEATGKVEKAGKAGDATVAGNRGTNCLFPIGRPTAGTESVDTGIVERLGGSPALKTDRATLDSALPSLTRVDRGSIGAGRLIAEARPLTRGSLLVAPVTKLKGAATSPARPPTTGTEPVKPVTAVNGAAAAVTSLTTGTAFVRSDTTLNGDATMDAIGAFISFSWLFTDEDEEVNIPMMEGTTEVTAGARPGTATGTTGTTAGWTCGSAAASIL